jgi:SAM-dependent methyltransferase
MNFRTIISYLVPPIFKVIFKRLHQQKAPSIDNEFSMLETSGHGLFKLIKDFEFDTVLDIGSGEGNHSKLLKKFGKTVTALDLDTSIYAKKSNCNYEGIEHIKSDFYDYETLKKYDCIWASHVLEHQTNPGIFIKKCMDLIVENGIIAITVPPMEEYVLGGHLTNWNAGILLYNLVLNGIDARDCSILRYGYNITVIVRYKKRDPVDLTYDNGDILKLINYFPDCVDTEPFNGDIKSWDW